MDRSFLSQTAVIAASRKFVCIRVATYEDETETKFSRSLMVGRSGEVENTTFALLAPDGKTRLSRAGRAARSVFGDAETMATEMERVATKYPAKETRDPAPLPIALEARVAMNIAAGDQLPVAIVCAEDATLRKQLSQRLATIAWKLEFQGEYVYAETSSLKDLTPLFGEQKSSGIYLVEPDVFGTKGKLIERLAEDATAEKIEASMRKLLASRPATSKFYRDHRQAAIASGVFWETKMPVTDPEELSARERTRQMMGKKP